MSKDTKLSLFLGTIIPLVAAHNTAIATCYPYEDLLSGQTICYADDDCESTCGGYDCGICEEDLNAFCNSYNQGEWELDEIPAICSGGGGGGDGVGHAGHYTTNGTDFYPCDEGTYCTSGSGCWDDCRECDTGTYQDATGATYCKGCGSYYYSSRLTNAYPTTETTGAASPSDCFIDIGTYNLSSSVTDGRGTFDEISVDDTCWGQ